LHITLFHHRQNHRSRSPGAVAKDARNLPIYQCEIRDKKAQRDFCTILGQIGGGDKSNHIGLPDVQIQTRHVLEKSQFLPVTTLVVDSRITGGGRAR
jgi:hypothetical protein